MSQKYLEECVHALITSRLDYCNGLLVRQVLQVRQLQLPNITQSPLNPCIGSLNVR